MPTDRKCPYCGSQDVFHDFENVFACEDCGEQFSASIPVTKDALYDEEDRLWHQAWLRAVAVASAAVMTKYATGSDELALGALVGAFIAPYAFEAWRMVR